MRTYWITRSGVHKDITHPWRSLENTRNGSAYSRKRRARKLYLNINRGITRSSLNQVRNPRSVQFTRNPKESLRLFGNTWTITWLKDLSENRNPEPYTLFCSYQRRTENYDYVWTIGNLTLLQSRTDTPYQTSKNCNNDCKEPNGLYLSIYEELTT